MANRRDFIRNTAAAGVVAATSSRFAWAADNTAPVKSAAIVGASPIKSAVRRDETILRLGGVGDNFHMSWAADDKQYVSVCDGTAWVKNPKGFYNSRLAAIVGGPKNAVFEDVAGYPDLMPEVRENVPRYYGFGTLALDGRLYQFLSTLNHTMLQPNARFVGAKLIYSPDNGATWRNHNGATPVTWEDYGQQSRETMVFFREAQDAFSLPSILQMGKNYEANRDGYVYVYAPNGNTEGTMNQLVMFRVQKTQLLKRAAYEFFAGLMPNGAPRWHKDISARQPIHTFPSGWVNKNVHPYAWQPSVVYNAPLGVYMMSSWGMPATPEGLWFAKPSYLGFWMSKNPWGPWTQIHEETAWTPGKDKKARAYQPQISPKWIAPDGKSFWLVWTDFQGSDAREKEMKERQRERHIKSPVEWAQTLTDISRRRMPYYSFNAQRVDLS